jgi:hypothetical protein
MEVKRKKLILTIIGGVLLYLASAGISYGAFRYLVGPIVGPSLISPVPVEEARSRIDLSAPKTEMCPLNGGMFTKAEEKIWEDRRPLAVMIENHVESRPQSGLSKADIVYEAVAEGGITRFLAVYYCGASAQDVIVGPVRSARIYYLDFVSEYGDSPLYVHVGGANDFSGTGDTHPKARALETIADLGWQLYNDLSADSLSFPVFWRDYERIGHPVATEHTMYSSTDKLWEVAHERGLGAKDDDNEKWDENFVAWEFKDETKPEKRGDVHDIGVEFWSGYGEYDVKWQYNSESNQYWRFNDGSAHKDLDNDEQIKAKVVIVQFMKETGPIDRNKHLLYDTTGKGKALVFQDGKAVEASWSKEDRQSRTKFTDSKGKQIEFNGGPIWIEIVPLGKEVSY